MTNVTKNHTLSEDIYIGYDTYIVEYCFELLRFRNRIPFVAHRMRNPEQELMQILRKNNIVDENYSLYSNLQSQDVAVLSDIFFLLKIPKRFLEFLEDYISNISFPYKFSDIKILRIYKNIIEKYNFTENNQIYCKILADNRKCDCVTAARNSISDKFINLDTKSLIQVLDSVSTKDKYNVLNLLLIKNFDRSILKTDTIYEKNFLVYLAYFLSKNDLSIKMMRYQPKVLINNNIYLDYILTLSSEENKKLIDLSNLFKYLKRKNIHITYFLLLHNLSRSVFILRSELIKYPVIEIILDFLSDNTNHKFDINTYIEINKEKYSIDYNYIYKDLETDYITVLLNILTNLLLEFGNYRAVFKSLNGSHVLERYLDKYTLEVLRLYKNYLYDNDIESKKDFLQRGDIWFKKFFNKYDEQIYEVLFNLIRNIFCDKLIIGDYLTDTLFLHLKENNTTQILLHLLYAIGNVCAYDIQFRDKVLNNNSVLERLKDLFIISELQLPLVWIIINLSWKDEGYKERVLKLNSEGFKDIILQLSRTSGVLLDKIQTAIENLSQ